MVMWVFLPLSASPKKSYSRVALKISVVTVIIITTILQCLIYENLQINVQGGLAHLSSVNCYLPKTYWAKFSFWKGIGFSIVRSWKQPTKQPNRQKDTGAWHRELIRKKPPESRLRKEKDKICCEKENHRTVWIEMDLKDHQGPHSCHG